VTLLVAPILLDQLLEDAGRLIAAWNERQAKRMPMLFSPTIGARSPRVIGFYGCAARRAAPQTRSTYERSIDTATRP
jgi:hypothetical protein